MIQYKNVLIQLVLGLNGLDRKCPTILTKAEKGLKLVTKAKNELDRLVTKLGFRNLEDEIHYFKSLKPKILSNLIFYSVLANCEAKRFSLTNEEYNILVRNKLDFVKAHYEDYYEFLLYYNSEAMHLDELYFVRSSVAKPITLSAVFVEEHSTGYDVVAAYIIAFKELKEHFENPECESSSTILKTNLEWTASRVALAELLYALKESNAINLGKIDLIELARVLGKIFNTEMDDIHRKFTEIKARKKDRCRFLTELIQSLEAKMDAFDE